MKALNKDKFRIFTKEAFQKADEIMLGLNEPVTDELLDQTFLVSLGTRILRYEYSMDSEWGYCTRVYFKKSYEVMQYLESIDSWEALNREDENTGIRVDHIGFMKQKEEIASINSHYIDYYNCYYWAQGQ